MKSRHVAHWVSRISLLVIAVAYAATAVADAVDPGVRRSGADNTSPQPMPGLSAEELAFFQDGLNRFNTVEMVSGAKANEGNGLGPRFNSNQCASCHSQPNVGGSSPATNPLLEVAAAAGASNTVPMVSRRPGTGQGSEIRYLKWRLRRWGVHDLFVVSGRYDAGSCGIEQPNFGPPGNPVTGRGGNPNIVYRIPTPTFGAGLIEAIPDSAILANMNANAAQKGQSGVKGHANSVLGGNMNLSANDGTVTRFGWKARTSRC